MNSLCIPIPYVIDNCLIFHCQFLAVYLICKCTTPHMAYINNDTSSYSYVAYVLSFIQKNMPIANYLYGNGLYTL